MKVETIQTPLDVRITLSQAEATLLKRLCGLGTIEYKSGPGLDLAEDASELRHALYHDLRRVGC